MPFSIDSNILIALSKRISASADKRVRQVHQRGHALYVSSIVAFELRSGAELSTAPIQMHASLDALLATPFVTLDFDDGDAREAAEIRTTLRRAGTPIGPYDVLIAGQARRRDLTLVTANVREFKRVPGLKVENWL